MCHEINDCIGDTSYCRSIIHCTCNAQENMEIQDYGENVWSKCLNDIYRN